MLQGFYRPAIRANNSTLVMDGNVEGIFGVELLKLADVRAAARIGFSDSIYIVAA